jgi:hypothetical protein
VGFVSYASDVPQRMIKLVGRTQPLLNDSGDERAGKPRPWLPGCGIDRRPGEVSARESAQLDVKLRSHAS